MSEVRPNTSEPVCRGLPRSWVILGVLFLVYTVLRLVQMSVWLIRAVW